MFPDGERKPGRLCVPERPAADEDAATAAMTIATAVEVRSDFMVASCIDVRAILRALRNSDVTAT
jgi:hypothetical protein